MLIDKQFEKITNKMQQMEISYENYIFNKIQELDVEVSETTDHLRKEKSDFYRPIKKGDLWGGEKVNGWFKGNFIVSKELEGNDIFITSDTGAIESMLFVEGEPKGIFANRIVEHTRGNHHTLLLKKNVKENEKIHFAVESYCWHSGVGTQPFEAYDDRSVKVKFDNISICLQNQIVKDFVFSLRIINQLASSLKDEFKVAECQNILYEVFKVVTQKPEEEDFNIVEQQLKKALLIMKPFLSKKNNNPLKVGIIGHSHMDTAWLWTIDETIRKCARTYSNALSLMDQYENYKFFQSSALHSKMMKDNYPSIFEGIKKRVKEGRYEPNGGVWVECDCNLASGESLIRQFLVGQRWTEKEYGYKSDVFWLPDTFGYSAALPQILKKCGIKYFLTTKMMWNDTNVFPYDTFNWRGLDGSVVFSHLNDIHCKPEPKHLLMSLYDRTRIKRVNQTRLISFGYGDGGGGPSYDLLEMAERAKDVEGCPKMEYTTVSSFMENLEKDTKDVPLYSGELYLELHRGTLTSQSKIKRNNRKGEISLHNLDLISSLSYLANKEVFEYEDLYKELLINQFHDILPGTSIKEVNDRSINKMNEMIENSNSLQIKLIENMAEKNNFVSLVNTLSWNRNSALIKSQYPLKGNLQKVNTLDGEKYYAEDLDVPSFGAISLEKSNSIESKPSVFKFADNILETPFFIIKLKNNGIIESLIDKRTNRNIVKKNGINTLYFNEDVPLTWDNWDIDADVLDNLKEIDDNSKFKIIDDGHLQFRLRIERSISNKSTLLQDIIFYANKRQIDFDCSLSFNDKHKLLKVGFDLDILSDSVKCETQFGYLDRNTYSHNSFEKAQFEYVNHKYSDMSENGFGISIINDCKYGINFEGSFATLSLIKSGTHPDPSADNGTHKFSYSILVHDGFSVENVVRKAYEFNYNLLTVENVNLNRKALIDVNESNVIIETVKISEEKDALIYRMYDAQKVGKHISLKFNYDVKKVELVDMLENKEREMEVKNNEINFYLSAFEIKSFKVFSK